MDHRFSTDANGHPLLDIPALGLMLWQRKLLISACVLLALGLAAIYLVVTKPTYTATAVLLIDPRETNATTSPNVLGSIGTDSAAIASQVTVIRSPELLRAVFEAEELANNQEFAGGGPLSFLGSSSSAESRFENFRSRVSVEREGLTYVINIGFRASDPDMAARLVNAIANRYMMEQLAEKSDANTEVTGQLNQSIERLRAEVASAETAVEEFRSAQGLFDAGSGRTLLDTQIEQLNNQLSAARETAREAEGRYQQAQAIGTSPGGMARLAELLSSGPSLQLRNAYNTKLTELANAGALYGPQHPARIRLEAEVQNLEGLMRGEANRIIGELRANNERADANIQRIEQEISRLQARASLTSPEAVELRQLERNADASRQVLEQFLARSEQISQLDNLQRADARFVSRATPPIRATWPRPSLTLAVAGLIGFMLGSAIALLTGEPERRSLAAAAAAPGGRPRPIRPTRVSRAPRHPTRPGSLLDLSGPELEPRLAAGPNRYRGVRPLRETEPGRPSRRYPR